MKAEELLDAIGLLPADLIAAADKCRTDTTPRIIRWRQWISVAACLVLLLSAGLVFRREILPGMGGKSEAAPQMSMEMASAADVPAEKTDERMEEACPEEGVNGPLTGLSMEHPMTLTLCWHGEQITAKSGNFTVNQENPDGTMETTIACGAHPLEANLEPVAVSVAEVNLVWPEMPDEISVQCWSADGKVSGEIPVPAGDGILTLRPEYQIYEITARWGDICTASYGVHLVYAE